ncbi:hypothetical protein EIP86_004143 [Pleurotus ostreatoroseus]|nr:hypothetical protein EIP86_004143 [Pleurotus ostreatoroseus]
MPHFLSGDEFGSIKSASFSQGEDSIWQCSTNIIAEGTSKAQAVQKLAISAQSSAKRQLAAARADGLVHILDLENSKIVEGLEWKETRIKGDQKFVGLSFTEKAVYSCTSNGALRRTGLSPEDTLADSSLAVLPTRLAEFRLSPDEKTLSYVGDEVELSVWDVERTFSATKPEAPSEASKRKRGENLLPNELWRAKNIPNDSLNLRQPVRNTCLTYLGTEGSTSQQQFLVGTQLGDVRRYDIRAARRPVSNWKGIGKVGGIGAVEVGLCDHQAFVADCGSNLYALDLRNGQISYGYKGVSGAITSVAVAPSFLVSSSSDRFLRLHSTYPPTESAGGQQEDKGQVLNKSYVKVTPTVVVWDNEANITEQAGSVHDDEDEAIWEGMADADTDEEGGKKKPRTT